MRIAAAEACCEAVNGIAPTAAPNAPVTDTDACCERLAYQSSACDTTLLATVMFKNQIRPNSAAFYSRLCASVAV